MDEPVVVNVSNSNNDNAIAKWIATNPEYPPSVAPIGNKLSFGPVVAANQVRFTATTKHTADRISGVTAGTGIGVGGGNGMGSGGNNGMDSAKKVGVGSVGMGFGGNNDVGSGAEVGAGGNPRDPVVCLGTLSTTVIGPASSQFNVAVPTSPTAGHGHPISVSSMV